MTTRRPLRLLTTGCALLGILWQGAGAAQPLADPTRPPTHLIDPARGGMAPGEVSANPLQSIIRSGKTRKALVNGELVKVGDRVGASVVESIGEAEVILRQEDGSKETLTLYPEVEIRRSRTKQRAAPAQKPAGTRQ